MVIPDTSVKRQARDGQWYNYQSFVDWYGKATARRKWADATDYDSFLANNPSAYELLCALENGCPILNSAIEGAAYISYYQRGCTLEMELLTAKASFESSLDIMDRYGDYTVVTHFNARVRTLEVVHNIV